MSERNHWIIVSSADNLAVTREHDFTVQGMKSRHRAKAAKMQPGDRLIWYLTKRKMFAATAIVTSTFFQGDDVLWTSDKVKADGSPENYPWRVNIEPEIVADEDAWIDAEPVARQMVHTRRWPAKNWTLAFQGNVHLVPPEDYDLIRALLAEAVARSGSSVTG